MKLVVAACAFGILFFACVVKSSADGLEYDQIVFRTASVGAHLPGSFDSDLTAVKTAILNGELGTVDSRKRMEALTKQAQDPAQKAALMAAAQIPIFGTMGMLIATNALRATIRAEGKAIGTSMTQAYQNEQRLGKWYRVVYLNGWTRREDVANQTMLIINPDDNERIHLDLALQTYYMTSAVDSPKSQADARAVTCAPSTTIDSGPQVVDGITTEFFTTTFNAPTMTVTLSRYESSYTEPPKRDEAGNLVPFDCPAGTAHTGPPMPTDRVALYSTMTITSGTNVASTLEEVGNINQGNVDNALFEVPPGFKEKRPGQ